MIESLSQLQGLMRSHGADRLFYKELSPNDNSKNQIYLGGDFSILSVLPYGKLTTDTSAEAGARKYRVKAPLSFHWIDESGSHHASNAQLVLYPKYPEVRLSGFLRGCNEAPSELMRSRLAGRVLFIGVTSSGRILAYCAAPSSSLANEITSFPQHRSGHQNVGPLRSISVSSDAVVDERTLLLDELEKIHRKSWIRSQRLSNTGKKVPYAARNGGGYTLEAELGIYPNGIAEPDLHGWEIKQFGVTKFETMTTKSPITLMTPEPTGGIYRDNGFLEFMRRYGYADRSGIAHRLNFGGAYKVNGHPNHLTGLRLSLEGYDQSENKITDLTDGRILLLDRQEKVAASWDFPSLMTHWERKHAKAAYVPSMSIANPLQYRYGSNVFLKEKTDFIRLLKAFVGATITYDPGMKIENLATKPKAKRRSQFRINFRNLDELYADNEIVDLLTR